MRLDHRGAALTAALVAFALLACTVADSTQPAAAPDPTVELEAQRKRCRSFGTDMKQCAADTACLPDFVGGESNGKSIGGHSFCFLCLDVMAIRGSQDYCVHRAAGRKRAACEAWYRGRGYVGTSCASIVDDAGSGERP